MNSRAINFLINFGYTLISNIVALVASILIVLIVPKLIGVEEYGYWQLYLFYSAYVGFMHLGWNDGIYLKLGGQEYGNLTKNLFFSQFYLLVFMQFVIALSISMVAMLIFVDENRIFIIQMTAVCLFIMNVRQMPLSILQATNRIKEYANILVIGKILYICFLIAFLLFGVRDFKLFILTDLLGKFLSLALAVYFCRDFIIYKVSTFYFSFREILENISVGIKLMFANIASLLIIGNVRFGIERSWDVTTFGKVSLVLSISNLVMLFINALGVIMFPILRRTEEKKLPGIYIIMRDLLMVILFGVLFLYYPIKIIMSLWLPDYSDSLIYLALLFPVLIYEGKNALLINTYLKTLRKEKMMLKINVVSLVLSMILTFITTIVIKNIELAVLSILILIGFRSVIAELYLSKLLKISLNKDIVLEVIVTIIFILTAWFINSWLTVFIYTMTFMAYLLLKKNDIISTAKKIRTLLMKDNTKSEQVKLKI